MKQEYENGPFKYPGTRLLDANRFLRPLFLFAFFLLRRNKKTTSQSVLRKNFVIVLSPQSGTKTHDSGISI